MNVQKIVGDCVPLSPKLSESQSLKGPQINAGAFSAGNAMLGLTLFASDASK